MFKLQTLNLENKFKTCKIKYDMVKIEIHIYIWNSNSNCKLQNKLFKTQKLKLI